MSEIKKYFGGNDLTTLLLLLKDHLTSKYVAKEYKTGSAVDFKVLSDNNLTDEMVEKIRNAGDSSFSGDYNDLTNKPFIPTKTSELTNDAGFLTEHQDISGKLDKTGDAANTTVTFTAATSRTNVASGDKLSTIVGKMSKWFSDMSTVAFSGSYNDLTNKPTIPTNLSQMNNDANYAKISDIPTNVSAFTNDSDYQTGTQVATSINNAVSGLASTTYVDGKINDLIGEGTPETLDTLKEIADKIASSDSDVAALTRVVAQKLNTADLVELTSDEVTAIWSGVFTEE